MTSRPTVVSVHGEDATGAAFRALIELEPHASAVVVPDHQGSAAYADNLASGRGGSARTGNNRRHRVAAERIGAWMSSPSQPRHLSNHQRNTLRQIFQHPAGHNIEWRAVLSLLEAVGSVEEQHGGKAAVTVGSQTEYFDLPRHKDIDTQAVVNLRWMLTQAGYGPGAADAGPRAGTPDP